VLKRIDISLLRQASRNQLLIGSTRNKSTLLYFTVGQSLYLFESGVRVFCCLCVQIDETGAKSGARSRALEEVHTLLRWRTMKEGKVVQKQLTLSP
jgi:hypothetical protein